VCVCVYDLLIFVPPGVQGQGGRRPAQLPGARLRLCRLDASVCLGVWGAVYVVCVCVCVGGVVLSLSLCVCVTC